MKRFRLRGSSLIECLVIMAVGSVIATLSIKLVHQSQIEARHAEQWLDLQQGMVRLERQLRQDLRSADSASLPDDTTLKVKLAKSTVQYEIKPGYVERSQEFDDAAPELREGYRLPNCAVAFDQPEAGMIRVVVRPNASPAASESYRIEQTIGRKP